MSLPSSNKGGRPVGSLVTPQRLIETELRNTVKTVQNIREILEQQMSKVNHMLTTTEMPTESILSACERLSIIMTTLIKNVETLGKYSIGDANRRKPIDSDTDTNTTGVSVDLRKLLNGK